MELFTNADNFMQGICIRRAFSSNFRKIYTCGPIPQPLHRRGWNLACTMAYAI